MSDNINDNNSIVEVEISDIQVGDRIREVLDKDDLKPLRDSIKADGLLQPIVINQANKLIAGFRRYTCCKDLGHKTILAKKVHTTDDLHEAMLELRENVIREDFTFSERMKAADKIEPIIAKKSKERMADKEPSDLTAYGISPEDSMGKTRDIMGKILGIGTGKTYEQARNVWKSKNENIISKLNDNRISINRANTLIKEFSSSKPTEKSKDKIMKDLTTKMQQVIEETKASLDANDFDKTELSKIFNDLSDLLVVIESKMKAVEKSPQV